MTSGQLFLFGETEDAKESHGRLWKTFSSRKYNSYNWYCELIFLVKLALQMYIIFYHISSSHNANTHIRAVFQRAATIVKSWYWSWSVGKPCQISNQHHCHHHHHHFQPTLSSPKSFQYKTYIFFLTLPTESYRWLSNKGWQVRLISLTLDTVYLPQQAGTFPLCHPLLSRNIFLVWSKLLSQKAFLSMDHNENRSLRISMKNLFLVKTNWSPADSNFIGRLLNILSKKYWTSEKNIWSENAKVRWIIKLELERQTDCLLHILEGTKMGVEETMSHCKRCLFMVYVEAL